MLKHWKKEKTCHRHILKLDFPICSGEMRKCIHQVRFIGLGQPNFPNDSVYRCPEIFVLSLSEEVNISGTLPYLQLSFLAMANLALIILIFGSIHPVCNKCPNASLPFIPNASPPSLGFWQGMLSPCSHHCSPLPMLFSPCSSSNTSYQAEASGTHRAPSSHCSASTTLLTAYPHSKAKKLSDSKALILAQVLQEADAKTGLNM